MTACNDVRIVKMPHVSRRVASELTSFINRKPFGGSASLRRIFFSQTGKLLVTLTDEGPVRLFAMTATLGY